LGSIIIIEEYFFLIEKNIKENNTLGLKLLIIQLSRSQVVKSKEELKQRLKKINNSLFIQNCKIYKQKHLNFQK